MKLWIHMGHERYAELQSGYLRQGNQFTRRENYYWAMPYSWLVGQMERRIGKRPAGVKVPLWGWHSFYGEHKRPDLRANSFTGSDDWMIGIDVDPGRVLLHDYQLWHFPLNGWYLPKTEEEAKQIEDSYNDAKYIYPRFTWESEFIEAKQRYISEGCDELRAYYDAMIEVYGSSWEQIFDLGYNISEYVDEPREIQATLWEVRKEDVFEVVRINRRSRYSDRQVHKKRVEQRARFAAHEDLGRAETYLRWDEIIEWGVK